MPFARNYMPPLPARCHHYLQNKTYDLIADNQLILPAWR
jgi:hypothetical protein